jgi:pyridoxine 5'-phosphate synthase PdxJ
MKTHRSIRPLAALPEVEEFNIGYKIFIRAALVGPERAVRKMVELFPNPV